LKPGGCKNTASIPETGRKSGLFTTVIGKIPVGDGKSSTFYTQAGISATGNLANKCFPMTIPYSGCLKTPETLASTG
jgi:hypothetical protein